jgi:Fic family protein
LHRQLNLDGGQLRRVKRKVDGPGAPPQQTATTIKAIEPALEQLLLTLDQALTDGLEPLLVIPLFSLDFMRIFPFLDGNRRICLLLTRHLLIRHGHPIFAYVDLESEVAVAGNAFYQALDGCQSEQAPHPWLAFWWLVLMRTYQRFNQQVMEAAISPGRGGKTALVEGFIAQQQGPFLFADISAALPTISTDLIRVVLRKLRDQGRVKASGRGRGTTWSATQQQTIEPTTGQLHALL